MTQSKQRIVARGFIEKEGKVLVIQRSFDTEYLPGVYELPGGNVEYGEDPKDALEREIREEIGLDAIVEKPYRVFSFTGQNGDSVVEIVFSVKLRSYSKPLQLESNFDGYTWVGANGIDDLEMHESMRVSLKEGFVVCRGDNGQPSEVPGMEVDEIKLSQSIPLLRSGQVGVIPTDTLYGVAGSVYNFETIERIYAVRKRTPSKPFIILLSGIDDLERFGIVPDSRTESILKQYWPGPVTFVLPCSDNKYRFLHRGKESLAFRVPANPALRVAIKQTGPLVAPSANPEGSPPALTIDEAKKYFGDSVDFYVDGGELNSKPSTVVTIIDGNIQILREGIIDIENHN